jgi:SAM-dependent methyltransferase
VDAWRAVEPHSITASDFADVCVAGLRRQFPDVTVRQLDVTGDLSALDGARFTLISAFDVLLHVVDDTQWQRALGNVYQMLQPGGLFLFSDNFVQGEPLRSAHVVHRSLAQQEAALREAGLEVVARMPLFVLMHDPLDRPPGWLRLWTRVVRRVDRLSAPIGSCLGALQYPVEILLTRLCRETPSVELMVCRRPS